MRFLLRRALHILFVNGFVSSADDISRVSSSLYYAKISYAVIIKIIVCMQIFYDYGAYYLKGCHHKEAPPKSFVFEDLLWKLKFIRALTEN